MFICLQYIVTQGDRVPHPDCEVMKICLTLGRSTGNPCLLRCLQVINHQTMWLLFLCRCVHFKAWTFLT